MNIKNKMKFTLELQNTIKATLKKEVSANLKEGSTGVYTDELIPLAITITRQSSKIVLDLG